ncbi:MAG: hypothetical protein RJB13_1594 [Pseudomonadota bacterium]|jgi:hypothetical protein
MKHALLVSGLCLVISGCASKPLIEESAAPFEKDTCLESPLVGLWTSDKPEGDRITFNQDCTAVSVKCQSRLQFPPNATQNGIFNIKVLESEGPDECLDNGSHRCSVSVLSNSATLTCDEKVFKLKRF